MGDDNGAIDDREHETERRGRMLSVGAAVTLTIGSFVTTSMFVGGSDASPIPAALDAATVAGSPYTSRINAGKRMVTDVGCLDDLSAASLDAMFDRRIGPILGLDNQHVIELGDGRRLWLFHDGFLDYAGTAEKLHGLAYLHSVAFVERDGCFRIIHQGDQHRPRPFEEGDAIDNLLRFYWPLGGEIGAGGKLYVFWARMQQDPVPGFLNGIRRHPVETWIGVYDPETFERLQFRRAPNSGVQPQYGFAVQSQGRYSYLFGNSNQLNLEYEGGYDNGPFTATRTYLGRVARGRFLDEPEYYTGTGWSPHPADARPISARFYTENAMQPRLVDGEWVSVTKKDGFLSNRFVIDVADHPWGPWRTVSQRRVRPEYGKVQVTYQPILLPWRDPRGDLIVMVSQNAADWPHATNHPRFYRPMVFSEPWPDEL